MLTRILLLKSLFILAIAAGLGQEKSDPTSALKKADSLYALSQWGNAIQQYAIYQKENSSLNAIQYYKMGNSFLKSKQLNLAIQHFKQSLTQLPKNPLLPLIQSRLSMAFSLLNLTDSSYIWMRKAVNNGYDNINELSSSPEFNNLRSNLQYNNLYLTLYKKFNPCSANPKNAEFDFWIGKWDVYQSCTNFRIGKNVIEKQAGGCVLVESWQAITSAESGKSLTYINEKGYWEQTYIASNGKVTLFANGIYADSIMAFKYESSLSELKKVIGKFIFKLMPTGEIKQYQEESTDSGKTWQRIYDFTYRKVE